MSNQTQAELVDNTVEDTIPVESDTLALSEQPVDNAVNLDDNTEESTSDDVVQTDTTNEDDDQDYEREDSDEGVITNIPEITQQQATHITDVIYNGLLGDYDIFGKYSISEDIIKELAHMPKRFVRKDKFGTYVQSKIGDITFNFCVTPPVQKDNGEAYCYLQLLEEISYTNGYIVDTKTTTIATYEYIYSDVFYDWVASAFNIDQDDGEPDGGRKYVATDYISLRLKYLKAVADMSIDLYEALDEAYFNKRIQILNELPEGTVILAEFNKERAKIEKYFVNNTQRKYKALNDLLNSILDGPAGEKIKENAEYNQKMAEANTTYLNKVDEINKTVSNSTEIQILLQTEAPIKKINFDNDFPKNVTKGEKYPPKKKVSKGKKPSVPKPDKYRISKRKKKPDDKVAPDVDIDILEKYKLDRGEYKRIRHKPKQKEPAPSPQDVQPIYRGREK